METPSGQSADALIVLTTVGFLVWCGWCLQSCCGIAARGLGTAINGGNNCTTRHLFFRNTVHLMLMANVILEFCYQREDAHDEPAGARTGIYCRIISDLELNALLGELRG
jgi:hypothetical protein